MHCYGKHKCRLMYPNGDEFFHVYSLQGVPFYNHKNNGSVLHVAINFLFYFTLFTLPELSVLMLWGLGLVTYAKSSLKSDKQNNFPLSMRSRYFDFEVQYDLRGIVPQGQVISAICVKWPVSNQLISHPIPCMF